MEISETVLSKFKQILRTHLLEDLNFYDEAETMDDAYAGLS